jgi:hypothetical protein
VCEVWKWITIGTGAPLIVLNFWAVPLLGRTDTILERLAQIYAHWRYLLLGYFVFVFALIVYAVHCNP